jgi:ABC-2 type transport system ATP-binding protein
VVIIADGRIVADGRPDDLAGRDANRFRVLFETVDTAAVRAKLETIGGVRSVEAEKSESGTVQFGLTTDGARDIRREIFRAAVDNGWPLLELDRKEASLEEVFRRLTKSEAAPAEAGSHEKAA